MSQLFKVKDCVYFTKPVYICDPKKNYDCRKTLCQEGCFFTENKEYSKAPDDPVYFANIFEEVE